MQASQDPECRIQVAPGVVYEALRLQDIPVRNRLIALMTFRRFERLMPEAYSEALEIVEEIRRLRPQWLSANPNETFFNRARNDWSRRMGGFWVRCAENPDLEAQRVRALEGELLEDATKQIRGARKQMAENGWKSNPPMDKTLASLPRATPGWSGEPVEAWRVESLVGITYALSRQGNPYREWICPFVEVDGGLLHTPDWVEFWLHRAEPQKLPRQWMRWGHSFAQRFRRVSKGSGGDNQLFSYLVETDLVISADKAFLEILEECRPFAPCSLPVGRLVPGGDAGVEAALELLNGD